MKIIPVIEFYARRHEQINSMFAKPPEGGPHGGSPVAGALELARAVLPIVIRRWPNLNPHGILDDALQTIEKVFDDPDSEDARRYPDAKQI